VLEDGEVDEIRGQAEKAVMEAVEFADASPEPELDSLYDHLYVLGDQIPGWYAVDERSPDTHPGEEEREAGERAQELAERGAAYAGPGAARKRSAEGDRPDEQAGPGPTSPGSESPDEGEGGEPEED
jgi:hypothetical protein